MTYIRKNDLLNFQHLQIPKKIWDLFINKKISTSAFKVYVEFFERVKLSSSNNWIDNDGNVYIKYSYNELMEILSTKSKGTIAGALEELKTLGLIIQEKRFNDTSRYYLTNILNLDFSNLEEGKKEEEKKENPTKNDDEIVSPVLRPTLVQETRPLTNILNLDFSNLEEGKKEEEKKENPTKNDDEIVSPVLRPTLVQETRPQKSSFIDANNINTNHNNLNNNSLCDEPIFIQQILQKYNELGLPKYEYKPSNKAIMDCVNMFGIKDLFNALEVMSKSDFCMNNFSVNTIFKTENIKKALKAIMDCVNMFGIKDLFNALEVMSKSDFCMNNFSVNTIFKTENIKKALNGSFKNRVNKKDKKIIPINKNTEYSDDKTSELYEKLGI